MTSQKGRDLLLKIGNGATPEIFTTIGAARTVSVIINNQPADMTAMDGAGVQSLQVNAGVQSFEIALDGLFRNAAAEELLRAAAFNRTSVNCQLIFPNGDTFAAAFVVHDYKRDGSYDGLEGFSVTLARTGAGTFTP